MFGLFLFIVSDLRHVSWHKPHKTLMAHVITAWFDNDPAA